MKEVSKNSSPKKHFRFKELKTYGDTEWILDNKKKYRQVFDKTEAAYIYVELALYNKNFDKTNWNIDIKLACVQIEPITRQICNLNLSKKISKYDSIAYIREGWGNKKKGTFWKAGKYEWQLHVGDELIASKEFHIVSTKRIFNVKHYLDIEKIGFFEGAYDDLNNKVKRKYITAFSQSHTRYIFCQILFKSLISKSWMSEFFIKFYNEQGDLKTVINRLEYIKASNDKLVEVIAGFGSNTRGSWAPGQYRVEVVFMDRLIAVTHFDIGDEIEEGLADVYLKYKDDQLLKSKPKPKKGSYEKTVVKLNRLIGLNEIKQKVHEHSQYLKFLQLRIQKGFVETEGININSVFVGNPGTGKTTVARLLGEIYHHMGLLSKGHVHEVDRVDLIGEFIGQTAPKVKEAIKKAKGGILFIDEAYSLARSLDDNKDFGREAIEILIKEMSSSTKDLAVIVAGYPKEMEQFINSNPGLKSRFKHTYDFKDYLPHELVEIADLVAVDKGVVFDSNSKKIITEIITDAYRNRDLAFGNARYVNDIVELSKINLGLRIMNRKNPSKISPVELQVIKAKDVINLMKEAEVTLPNIPIDQELLKESMKELDDMIGIVNVKKQVKELVEIVKYHRLSGKNVLSSFNLHTVFIGNPGTGKTTVARILAKIYKALGILERGHLVETDRQGLIAGFVGQTAIKTSERIDEAMGGVLFIDEAYSLSNFNGLQGDFGNEAIQALLKRMEDDRSKFFLFVAGYPDNMQIFLKANPGLSSRFDKILEFEDYSAEEMTRIGIQMAKIKNYHLNKAAINALDSIAVNLVSNKTKYFGNARTVRQLINDTITNQNLRISMTLDNEISTKQLNTIIGSDVIKAMADNNLSLKSDRQIGFN